MEKRGEPRKDERLVVNIQVARIMCDQNVASIPVVMDQESRKLVGMITDRDLCCSVIADGLDPKVAAIEKFMTLNPVTCRDTTNA